MVYANKMSGHIQTKFDREINAFIVSMPEFITLEALKAWNREFLTLLCDRTGSEKAALLLDTNRHAFESAACLKLLRDLLANHRQISTNISRVAFVQPGQYREPGIVSPVEAYFSQFREAYNWLKQSSG